MSETQIGLGLLAAFAALAALIWLWGALDRIDKKIQTMVKRSQDFDIYVSQCRLCGWIITGDNRIKVFQDYYDHYDRLH